MIKYQVRSRDLVDMITDINSARLILSPYFQRNLVWRELHKKDFIETILKGYPFPQIFIARGEIDVDTMTSQSCVVDGQQRMNAIVEFLKDTFSVNGQKFSQLANKEKQNFLTYQVPVIDLDIKAEDTAIIDIFTRLNRTFYSLSNIEKMSTEFATVDLMLFAKYFCNLISSDNIADEEADLTVNPNMPDYFKPWAAQIETDNYKKYIFDSNIFTTYETSRMVHLMYTLNLLATVINGFYNRNDGTKPLLDREILSTNLKNELAEKLEKVAALYNSIGLSDSSIWKNKANSFSLFVLFFWNFNEISKLDSITIGLKLQEFAESLPSDYSLAAREGVNNKKERLARHTHLSKIFDVDESPRLPVN